MITRRSFIKIGGVAGTGLVLPWKGLTGGAVGRVAGPTLDPTLLAKYVTPLVIPPAMPATMTDYYEIAVRQFQQQVLPSGWPATTLWSYGSVNHPGSFNYPAFTIEAKVNTSVRVKWINDLVDDHGHYLPHLLAVDPTLHWANPPGPRDARPNDKSKPKSPGPVPW
jgi:FtsP/CotA-like multicopper oxidase with cupredoxin domain